MTSEIEDQDLKEAVDEILNKVKTEGDAALFAYTKEFDKTEISADTIKVTEEEIKSIIQESTDGGEIAEIEQDIVESLKF